ncbi:sigma-70 family RNA polymerase sigma factor [Paenibacillus prosopidis]|uniref:RNA polymerase sigma factor (Sigma-70 family) n=1 Tax=Paenibacillus prosopidis TaxID=630520 RepID=A0A368VT15_9BACL|nr:sigma-70 family RNA polymerase sigma factor [Paenibacillus prosopidis]RCW44181.1 RNA polymerase sigma factor (sigma-70 family) [Paenibacillus prosopidis]
MEHSAPDLFRQQFNQHYPSVRRKLFALIRDEAAAEDLAQETFLRLYRNPPDQPEAIGGWLHRVLTRLAYDYMDKKARERAITQKQEQNIMAQPHAVQSNEQTVIALDERERVQGWLESLPERDKQMLLLRYEGYSYAEIAEQLQVRQPQVGTMLRRAGERLKRHALQAEGAMSHE